MIKYGILAAVPALVLAVPTLAQTMQPLEAPAAPNPPMTTMAEAPPPPPMEMLPPGANPDVAPGPEGHVVMEPSAPSPGFVWLPGHYNWDPRQGRYVWLVGQYVQPPRPDARWVDGRWQLGGPEWAPQYVWIDGHWD